MGKISQSEYQQEWTGNVQALVGGYGSHFSHISFHEFMTKPDADFFFSDEFFQIPEYSHDLRDTELIPYTAREAVRQFVIDKFSHRLLCLQNYEQWGREFNQSCKVLTIPFWAQVHMESIMKATELEMDENTSSSSNMTQGSGGGNNTSTSRQVSDSSNRTGVVTTVAKGELVTDELEYDWSRAANNFQESRTRAGDVTNTTLSNSSNTTTNISSNTSEFTNKQFMQERKLAIETAQILMPLDWLENRLDLLFNWLY